MSKITWPEFKDAASRTWKEWRQGFEWNKQEKKKRERQRQQLQQLHSQVFFIKNSEQAIELSQSLEKLNLHQVWRRLEINKPYISDNGIWRIGFFKVNSPHSITTSQVTCLAIRKHDGSEEIVIRLVPTLMSSFARWRVDYTRVIEFFYRSEETGERSCNIAHVQGYKYCVKVNYDNSHGLRQIYLNVLNELKEARPNFEFIGGSYSFSSLCGNIKDEFNKHLSVYTPRLFSFVYPPKPRVKDVKEVQPYPEDVMWNMWFDQRGGFSISFEEIHKYWIPKRIFLGKEHFTWVVISSIDETKQLDHLAIDVRVRKARSAYVKIDLIKMKIIEWPSGSFDVEGWDFYKYGH